MHGKPLRTAKPDLRDHASGAATAAIRPKGAWVMNCRRVFIANSPANQGAADDDVTLSRRHATGTMNSMTPTSPMTATKMILL